MTTIKNFNDLAAMYGVDDDDRDEADRQKWISRAVYKYTDCGPWIEFEPEGVTIGSIVEGSEEEPEPRWLPYPFTLRDLERTLAAINEEAGELWDAANLGEDEDEDE